jgi:HD-like signal output (HDOD) protein
MPTAADFERHLARVEGLFPLPQILARAAARARDPASTVAEVAAVLVLDPAIVRTVIGLSNSAYFNRSSKSESLIEAVQRIGVREILRLVGCSIAREVYRRELVHYRIPPEVFWESAIAAALMMSALARERGGDEETAYLAGLMREVGMLVIDQVLAAEKNPARWDCYSPVRDWEFAVAGHAHPEIGAELLNRWAFAPAICAAVRHQWDDNPAGDGLAQALQLTNLTLERCGCDFSLPLGPFEPYAPLAAGLGLTAGALDAAISDAQGRFKKLRQELGPV